MNKKQAGYLGGLARMEKYGNPGTREGRRKGGKNSIVKNLKLGTNFKAAKKHKKPFDSKLLAEFMGILFGDGHLSDYQVSITTNSKTDTEHAVFIKNLMTKLFNVSTKINFKKDAKAVSIVVSSVNLVKWLSLKGMPKGNKLEKGLRVPEWIKGNKIYEQKFIRGLFDTDGCVYVDRHKINGKLYKNQGWAFTNYSNEFRNEIFVMLRRLGFNPTLRKSQKSIYMRKKYDIIKYFKEVGTSNSKHLKRFQEGRVPERS